MYSRITSTSNGRDAIAYAEGTAHDGSDERNVLVTPINLLPDGRYADQMERYWLKARKNHRCQVKRIILSFSKKELDPYSDHDIEIANNIVKTFCNSLYKGRQAVCYLQRDGKGHCLHAHIIVNDCDENGHACSKQQSHYKYVRKGIDKIAGRYFKLDSGEQTLSKRTQTERVKTEKAAKIKEDNPSLSEADLRQLLIEKGAYSYRADMKQKIRKALDESQDEKSFIKHLQESGIDVTKKSSKTYGAYYLYDFFDCPINVKNTRSRSYKLGHLFSPAFVSSFFKERKNAASQANKKNKADAFTEWMHSVGESYFIFDDHGRLVGTDFEKMEKLHERFEKEAISEAHNTKPVDSSPVSSDIMSKKSDKSEDKKKAETNISQFVKTAEIALKRLKDDEEQKQISARRQQRIREEINIEHSPAPSKDKSL